MPCNCKKKVKELAKYGDEGADRKFEVGFLGKVWRILTGTVITVLLAAVGICLFPLGIAVVAVRAMFGKQTKIDFRKLMKKEVTVNGR